MKRYINVIDVICIIQKLHQSILLPLIFSNALNVPIQMKFLQLLDVRNVPQDVQLVMKVKITFL